MEDFNIRERTEAYQLPYIINSKQGNSSCPTHISNFWEIKNTIPYWVFLSGALTLECWMPQCQSGQKQTDIESREVTRSTKECFLTPPSFCWVSTSPSLRALRPWTIVSSSSSSSMPLVSSMIRELRLRPRPSSGHSIITSGRPVRLARAVFSLEIQRLGEKDYGEEHNAKKERC